MSETSILRLTESESRSHLGDIALNLAKTIYDRRTGDARIIVDVTLSPVIQEVLIEHELVQLGVIRESERVGLAVDSVLAVAHESGLRSGMEMAERLGVLSEYMEIRSRK